MTFWGELKRRNVFKVGAAYVIVAWLIVQVANTFFPILNLPDWAVTLVAVLLILGLPVTLIIAWAFELTPDGVKRSEIVPLDESITHVTGRKLNYVLIGVIIIAVAYILFDNFYLDRRVDQTEAHKTIAVLPFADMSPDKDQEYFVDGLSEELLNSLTQIKDLQVIARTSSFVFKGSDKKIQEIADELGASHILEGSVRKAGDALRITAQLIRAADGIHLWSETYDRKLEDIFAVQEDIATAVANELKITLGIGSPLKQLGGTDNEKAYEYYLVAKGQQFNPTAITRALESINAAIAIDPEFARAWALKATLHILQTVYGPSDLAESQKEEALHAAQKAIDMDPDLPAGYVSLGYTKMGKGEWAGAESDFRKALELSTESLSSDEIIYAAVYYMGVGYFQKAFNLLTEWRRKDPLNANLSAFSLFPLVLSGDNLRVEEELKFGKKLFGDEWAGGYLYLSTTGNIDPEKIDVTTTLGRIATIGSKNFESPEKGLMELRRMYQDEKNLSGSEINYISTYAAYLGDYDFAMDAMEKGYQVDPGGLFVSWVPMKMEVRKTPRFKKFLQKIGLVDYWNEFGWPDLCHPMDDGDFVCE